MDDDEKNTKAAEEFFKKLRDGMGEKFLYSEDELAMLMMYIMMETTGDPDAGFAKMYSDLTGEPLDVAKEKVAVSKRLSLAKLVLGNVVDDELDQAMSLAIARHFTKKFGVKSGTE